ncbi:unnamed protein product [Eruca vesicaria subsp. sativa]|uniref:F-box domain-containing protein n=1 Tax=Eruca vesicaria subsp. sativa TaxID=29727 RepID=A0ABC8JEQ3_ERUVS|nr:unnamed protein product [Eruca vesicaria subsp. sativa]
MFSSQRLKTSLHGMWSSDLSTHQVVNNDDIMCEIFLLLPPETVYKLILVSKRWLQIISNPLFRRSYLNKWKKNSAPIGFFICKTKNSGSFKYELRLPPFEFDQPPRTILGDEIKSLRQLGHYIDSSKDFILCSSSHHDYYLWNPITHLRNRIPHPSVHFELSCTSLIIEDSSHVFSYMVIRADCVNKPSEKLRVEIFSSKTNIWSYSELTCPEPVSLMLESKKVINGVVYWYAVGGKVVIFDLNKKEEKRIDLVKLPRIHYYDKRVLAGSDDGCIMYGRCTKSVMEIWKLEKVNGVFQWKHQHKLNFKVVWTWYDVKAERSSIHRKEVKKLLAFPIRNETSGEIMKESKEKKEKKEKKEEEQGVPYGMCGMACHSFDDIGFPFFIRYIRGADVSMIIGKKLLSHYISS